MIKTYLVRFAPLEPFFFGSEETFKYPGTNRQCRDSYYITSCNTPEQTTILGTLRYLVLDNKSLLSSSFNYNEEAVKNISAAVGKESFSFNASEVQSFGAIESVSPLFIVDSNGDYYVKNPFNNKSKSGYSPIRMSENAYSTSLGKIMLPDKDEFDPKKGIVGGYINLNNMQVVDDLFNSIVMVGNRKNVNGTDKDGSFFKREMKSLKEGYSFAVFVDAEEGSLPKNTICYMGQKKNAFSVTVTEAENNLVNKVEMAFQNQQGTPWCYALSDLVLADANGSKAFAIVYKKTARNLKTSYTESNSVHRLKPNASRLNLVESGSVYYREAPALANNENNKKIGYNYIIRIGG